MENIIIIKRTSVILIVFRPAEKDVLTLTAQHCLLQYHDTTLTELRTFSRGGFNVHIIVTK